MFGTNKLGDKLRRARTGLMRDDRAIMERSHLLAMRRIEDEPDVATAMTDGINLFINVPWIEQFETGQIQFVLLHEARHRMLKHPIRFPEMIERAKLTYPTATTSSLWAILNIAADYRINDDLMQDGWINHPPGAFDTSGKYRGWSVMRIFMDLLNNAPQQKAPDWGSCSGLPGGGGGKASRDDEREFDQTVNEQNETSMKIAQKRGTMPGSMKTLVAEAKAKPDWDKQLPAVLSRIRGGDDYSMARVSNAARRQRMVMPGVVGTTLEHVVMGIDTSGSIGQGELALFIQKINSIVRVENPVRLTIMQVDTRVQDVTELEEGATLPTINVKGRGGTAFQPAFDYVEKMGWTPDCMVYLTDGHAPFDQVIPDYPVIWLITSGVVPPYGTVIHIH